MSARVGLIWGNAAWREAVRLREPYVDVDHLMLGLVATGGPAARLLAHHGVTLVGGRRAVSTVRARALALLGVDATALPSVAPLAASDLHRGKAGHARMTLQAERLFKRLRRGSTERDYLQALLAEPSGMVREVLGCAGVDLDALQEGLAGAAINWRTPTPRRVASSTSVGRGHRVDALRLEHWVSGPHHLVHHVATDLASTTRWLTSPDENRQPVTGRSRTRIAPDSQVASLNLLLAVATPSQVRWETWWGGRYGGSHTLDLEPIDSGTLVQLTREITTFGRFAAVAMPPVRLINGLGMPTMLQNLSFACADAIEDEQCP